MAPIPSLQPRYVYYYTTGLSTGAIAAIAVISSLTFILSIFLCIRRARANERRVTAATANYYPNQYPTVQQTGQQVYGYRTADGQPANHGMNTAPIYSTTSGNPAYPQGQQKDAAGESVIAGVPPVYSGSGPSYGDAQTYNQHQDGVIR